MGHFSRNAEKILDYAVFNWKKTLLLLLATSALGTGLIAYAYSDELAKTGTLLGFLAAGLALKYPGRYAAVGGTDIDTALMILVSAGAGVHHGVLFTLAFIPLASKIAIERPQDTLFSLALHTGLVLLAGLFTATPETIVFFVMAFVLLSVAIMAPVLYYTGKPPQAFVVAMIIKVAWAYVFLRAFGVRMFEMLR